MALGVLLAGCAPSGDTPGPATPAPAERREAAGEAPMFVDVAAPSGLNFTHHSGATPEHFMPEIMGSGGALFDMDGDGDLDVLLLQGGRINAQSVPLFPIPAEHGGNRLFRNELVPGGTLAFTDVTGRSGLGDDGYSTGVATGDVDNDGDQDVFITTLTVPAVYLNDGSGAFTRGDAGVPAAQSGWGTSISLLDYDLDGALDAFVTRYVAVDLVNARHCSGRSGQRDYCTPDVYHPLPDLLLRGDGKGGFALVTGWRATPLKPGPGLGVVSADFNLDGWPDLYVANDKKANHLWMNRRDGTFEEVAVLAGSAFDVNGTTEASMGVTSADVDADGDEDLFLTHLKGETNTVYLNMGAGGFIDATIDLRLSSVSVPSTGFGTRWFDVDNDGDLDLFATNGAVMAEPEQIGRVPFPYTQWDQLFVQTQPLRYEDASERAGLRALPPEIGRGAAFGDVDNDGDVDILVSNSEGSPRLLRNDAGAANPWLSVRLRGARANRDGIGARIGVERAGAPTLWRRVGTDGSYLSASDVRTHFGLGDGSRIEALRVVWPGGQRERFDAGGVNAFVTLVQGEGAAAP